MTTALDADLDALLAPPQAAPSASPRATAHAPRVRTDATLAKAGAAYVVLELAAAWGWLHWRADLREASPSVAVTMLLRSAVLLVFVSAVAQAWERARSSEKARDAACVGVAALLLHAPWTLIILKWPHLAAFWLLVMCLATIAATAKLGIDRASAALLAAPYTAWLVGALVVDATNATAHG